MLFVPIESFGLIKSPPSVLDAADKSLVLKNKGIYNRLEDYNFV